MPRPDFNSLTREMRGKATPHDESIRRNRCQFRFRIPGGLHLTIVRRGDIVGRFKPSL